jgi:hypothetical protein
VAVNSTDRTPAGDVERTLDREVELLMSAVNLIASGGAPSATVAGLRLAEAAMSIVGPRAKEQGVVLDALWGTDEDELTCDVRVRRPTTE